jgi:uncharacterized membrane-anchored protein
MEAFDISSQSFEKQGARGRGNLMKSGHACAICAALLLVSAVPQAIAAQPAPTANEAQAEAAAEARFQQIQRSLHPQSGSIAIPAAHATLQLGKDYYFLPPDEAKRVLTEGWGNRPEIAENVLGMVFPAGKTFRDRTWGAVIEYEDHGHISDKDAATQDYASVLSEMQQATEDSNEDAKQHGYSEQHLLGWAQPPTYDGTTKTLIWARNIQFGDQPENSLNYDVRTLSRTGVLSLNMVDSMSNLDSVREAAKGLGSTVKFDAGSRYADYNPSTDKLADYGLAGLVAAGAGLAVAKKAGLLAILLVFAKKGIALIIAAAVGARAWFKRKLARENREQALDAEPAEALPPAE